MRKMPSEQGQTLLIILLIVSVALTIGLSLISRSVTDISLSEKTEDAARAYSAAEAGIEQALMTGVGANDVSFPENNARYSVSIGDLAEGSTEFAFSQPFTTDQVQTLWLATHDDLIRYFSNDHLGVYWGNSGTPSNSALTPALEVTMYYNDGGTYEVTRFALDPNTGRSNSFCNPDPDVLDSPTCDKVDGFYSPTRVDGKDFQFGALLDLSNFVGAAKVPLFARLRLLYSDSSHFLGAKVEGTPQGGQGAFPAQGERLDSTGQSGDATRKVEVVRWYPAPPPIFDFALYSGSSLNKQ